MSNFLSVWRQGHWQWRSDSRKYQETNDRPGVAENLRNEQGQEPVSESDNEHVPNDSWYVFTASFFQILCEKSPRQGVRMCLTEKVWLRSSWFVFFREWWSEAWCLADVVWWCAKNDPWKDNPERWHQCLRRWRPQHSQESVSQVGAHLNHAQKGWTALILMYGWETSGHCKASCKGTTTGWSVYDTSAFSHVKSSTRSVRESVPGKGGTSSKAANDRWWLCMSEHTRRYMYSNLQRITTGSEVNFA